jgi:ATP-dependent RNA helicase RhlE
VHRIGRTGRAGADGCAVSLVCSEETGFLRDIERLMQRRVERVVIEGFEPSSGMARFDSAPPAATYARSQQRRPQRNEQGPANGARGGNGRNGNRPYGGQPARRAGTQQRRNDSGRGRPGAALPGGNR